MYIIRLDDASEYMDVPKWEKMKQILVKYGVKPIVGVIPDNRDPSLTKLYSYNLGFWDTAHIWQSLGWRFALHGYNHVFNTQSRGINPVNFKSEFADLSLIEQKRKIGAGFQILLKNGIHPDIFFAPAHTFDNNTLIALREMTDIRIISDTVANNIYFQDDFFYIPQQTGKLRKLPLGLVTICLHPNNMKDKSFGELDDFLCINQDRLLDADQIVLIRRKFSFYDGILRLLYFLKKKL